MAYISIRVTSRRARGNPGEGVVSQSGGSSRRDVVSQCGDIAGERSRAGRGSSRRRVVSQCEESSRGGVVRQARVIHGKSRRGEKGCQMRELRKRTRAGVRQRRTGTEQKHDESKKTTNWVTREYDLAPSCRMGWVLEGR